jgi:ABC-type polysaccharide/polyol phosphate export permease
MILRENQPIQPPVASDTYALPSRTRAALDDVVDGVCRSWIWSALAVQDIKLRYRGSVLGPFWLSISTAIMVAAMGGIYARLFETSTSHYLSFLAIGLVLWQFISSVIIDGCQTFLSAEQIIQQVRMPFSVHAWRTVYRNLLVSLHCAVILPIVLILFPSPLGWHALTFIPALALLAFNSFWITMLLGMISARYRDIPPIVASALQIMFFVTPIFWPPELLGYWHQWLPLNPLFAAIDVVRAPLLGTAPLAYSWTAFLLLTFVGNVLTFGMLVKFRPNIAYWV